MKDLAQKDGSLESASVNAEGDETRVSRFPRVCVQLPVLIYSSGEGEEAPTYDEAKTIHVDPQGALLTTSRTVVAGQSILLINPKSGKEMVCLVRSVNPDESGVDQVDIEFPSESRKFWKGIKFPAEGTDQINGQINGASGGSPQSLAPPLDISPEIDTETNSAPAGIRPDQEENDEGLMESAEPQCDSELDPVLDLEVASELSSECLTEQPGELTSDPSPETCTETNRDSAEIHPELCEPPDLVTTQAEADLRAGAGRETPEANDAAVAGTPSRRGPRVHLEVPVLVGLPGESFPDKCKTIEVGAFGALIVSTKQFEIGQSLIFTNPNSKKQITGRVRNVRRVESGEVQLGVEFPTESHKFWGMTFPSGDTSDRKVLRRPGAGSDPSFRPLPGQFGGYSENDLPTTAGTHSNLTKIRNGHEKAPDLLTKPAMKPSSQPERGLPARRPAGGPEPVAAQAEENIDNAGNESEVDAPARTPARRGQRVHLEVPVLVSLPGETSQHECKTIEVGAFGALIVLPGEVDPGQSLVLTNPKSLKQITCRVRYAKEKGPGEYHAGVEFGTESHKFWGMTFPTGDTSERKLPQRPVAANDPSFRPLPGHSADRPAAVGKSQTDAAKQVGTRWSVVKWPVILVAASMALFALWTLARISTDGGSKAVQTSTAPGVAPEDALKIPGIESSRLATAQDFDPDAVSWLRGSSQQVSGEIPGAFAAFGQSKAYVLVGKDAMWRIVILVDGHLRCDAKYRSVAIVVRVPKQAIQNIVWANPPPAGSEGDGLLVVRSANDLGSGVVLLLRGDDVVSGTPSNYQHIPLVQLP